MVHVRIEIHPRREGVYGAHSQNYPTAVSQKHACSPGPRSHLGSSRPPSTHGPDGSLLVHPVRRLRLKPETHGRGIVPVVADRDRGGLLGLTFPLTPDDGHGRPAAVGVLLPAHLQGPPDDGDVVERELPKGMRLERGFFRGEPGFLVSPEDATTGAKSGWVMCRRRGGSWWHCESVHVRAYLPATKDALFHNSGFCFFNAWNPLSWLVSGFAIGSRVDGGSTGTKARSSLVKTRSRNLVPRSLAKRRYIREIWHISVPIFRGKGNGLGDTMSPSISRFVNAQCKT
ncbi:hypothetical protein CSHISOI_03265 [Colletotrichum shisoi]|uniref:Uncharacterized protein n=1 Tax=Colletotrichum shisoi TaxID=2078593 RepID=A0A5Q4BYQ2_9PEZI|nr:hypothetical protein CSHISOI_03265 [Colletotrichum shisoi]